MKGPRCPRCSQPTEKNYLITNWFWYCFDCKLDPDHYDIQKTPELSTPDINIRDMDGSFEATLKH